MPPIKKQRCDRCVTSVPITKLTEVMSGRYVCLECLTRYYKRCPKCQEYHVRSMGPKITTKMSNFHLNVIGVPSMKSVVKQYCTSCARKISRVCESCGQKVTKTLLSKNKECKFCEYKKSLVVKQNPTIKESSSMLSKRMFNKWVQVTPRTAPERR